MMRFERIQLPHICLIVQQCSFIDNLGFAATIIKQNCMIAMRHNVERPLTFKSDARQFNIRHIQITMVTMIGKLNAGLDNIDKIII